MVNAEKKIEHAYYKYDRTKKRHLFLLSHNFVRLLHNFNG